MRTKTPPTAQAELFIDAATDWLENARLAAEQIGARQGTFTIIDVLGSCPFPAYLGKRKKNLVGQVLTRRHFRHVGYTRSTSPAANGRVIGLWSLKEQPLEKWRGKAEYDTGD